MEIAEFFDHRPGLGFAPIPLPNDLSYHEPFLVENDDHGDHPDLIGIDDLFFQDHEDRQCDLQFVDDLANSFLPFSVDTDREDGDLVFFPFRKFFQQHNVIFTGFAPRTPEEKQEGFPFQEGKGGVVSIQTFQGKRRRFLVWRESLNTKRGTRGTVRRGGCARSPEKGSRGKEKEKTQEDCKRERQSFLHGHPPCYRFVHQTGLSTPSPLFQISR